MKCGTKNNQISKIIMQNTKLWLHPNRYSMHFLKNCNALVEVHIWYKYKVNIIDMSIIFLLDQKVSYCYLSKQ